MIANLAAKKRFLNLVASHKSLDSHFFSFSSLTYSQIWLTPLMDHRQVATSQNRKCFLKNTPELNVAISPNKSSVTSLRTWSGVRDWWMLLLLLLHQHRGRESPGARGQNYALLNNPSLANSFHQDCRLVCNLL
jgi:hypothetical protein